MEALCAVVTILAGLVTLVWASRHVQIWAERRKDNLLRPTSPGPPPEAQKISVLIAAKDEAENIETCVRTVLQQDYPDFEVIVVNDRSDDDTGAIVQRIAEADGRVRLINIEHLPEGWLGKNNAMQTGIRQAGAEWICMLDADCRQTSGRTLSTAMQYALDTGADLLSVLPVLEMRGFWENVIQPVCGGVMMIWFKPNRVNDPNCPTAYANGAFMLIRREAYEAIGTHEAVRKNLNEDMAMARRIKQAGLKLRVVRNEGLYLVRMYTSLSKILRGWARIFLGTFGTLERLAVSLLVLVVMGLFPYAAVAIGFGCAAGAGGSAAWPRAAGVAGVLAASIQISVIYRFYKLIHARKNLAWSYPIGCVVAIIAVAIALSHLRPGAKVMWKGTGYSGSGQGASADSPR